MPFFCGFIGCLLAGWLSDKIIKKTEGYRAWTPHSVVIAMLGMAAFTVPAALVQDNNIAVFCISVVIFLTNAASACSGRWSRRLREKTRRIAGVSPEFRRFLGGSLPDPHGFIASTRPSCALLTGAAIAFIGAASYFLLVREPMGEK